MLQRPEGCETGKHLEGLLGQVPARREVSSISQWVPAESARHMFFSTAGPRDRLAHSAHSTSIPVMITTFYYIPRYGTLS